MMTKNLQRKIKNTALIFTLAFGFLMVSGITANAQYGNDDYYRQQRNRDRRDRDRERREEERERRQQRRQNQNDGYYGRNGDYDRNDDSNRNDGYYGNNGGYNRNDGYNRNNGYNNVYRIAQQNGYNDGLRKGQEDARERHHNPTGTSDYKRATNGYNSSYGNKNAYKDAYRQAFLQGFEDSYNRYNNNGRYGNNRNRTSNGAGDIFRRIITGY